MEPGPNSTPRDLLRTLAGLREQPAEQAAFATTILATNDDPLILDPPMQVLAEHPWPAARTELIRHLNRLQEDGRKRDPGGFLRTAAVAALGHIALPQDLALLEAAVATKEPTLLDARGPSVLRAAALIGMNRVDQERAELWAARLLGETDWINPASGEPALTAARVLATNEQFAPLLLWATAVGEPAEVQAECLRSLAQLDYPLIAAVVETSLASDDELVAIALADLFATRREDAGASADLADALGRHQTPELYAYLVAAVIAGRGAWQRDVLLTHAESEFGRQRLQILDEHLGFAPPSERLAGIRATIRGRLGARKPPVRRRGGPPPPIEPMPPRG